MKIKTSELTGVALDWAVAKCEGYIDDMGLCTFDADLLEDAKEIGCLLSRYHPSTNWAKGGPIIERENIFLWCPYGVNGKWSAKKADWGSIMVIHDDLPLVAAMRCYVASKLGNEVSVPDELK